MPRIRLRTQYLLLTVSLVAMTVAVLAGVLQRAQVEQTRERLDRRGATIARLTGTANSRALLAGATLELRQQARETVKAEPGVAYVYFLDRHGELLAHSFDGGFPPGLKEATLPHPHPHAPAEGEPEFVTQAIRTEQGIVRDICYPLYDGSLGYLHVGLSEKGLNDEIRQSTRLILLIAGAILLLSIPLSLLISRRIARPLEDVTAAAREMEQGKLDVRVPGLRRNDELGELAHAFNAMAETMQRSQTELQDANIEMEMEIDQRRQTEKTLWESLERYDVLFNKGSDMAWVHAVGEGNLPGPLLEVNDAVCQTLGYSRQELLGHLPVDFHDPNDLLPPSQLDVLFTQGRLVFDRTLRTRDGRGIPVEVNAAIATLEGKKVVMSTMRDVTERRQAQEAMAASLREKEYLLKEIHHRVKNNLQVISSILDLQVARLHDPSYADVFRDCQRRVRTMALLHEGFYRTGDQALLDMAAYVRSLVTLLFRSSHATPDEASLRLEVVEGIHLPPDTALLVALILNELVSNALKHAFAGGRRGILRVGFRPLPGDKVEIEVADDGPGLPPGFDPRKSPSLGLTLVTVLSEQMGGRIETGTAPEGGALFTITITPALHRPASDQRPAGEPS